MRSIAAGVPRLLAWGFGLLAIGACNGVEPAPANAPKTRNMDPAAEAGLQRLVDVARTRGRVLVMVQLVFRDALDGTPLTAAQIDARKGLIRAGQQRLLAALDIGEEAVARRVTLYSTIPFFAADLTPPELERLRQIGQRELTLDGGLRMSARVDPVPGLTSQTSTTTADPVLFDLVLQVVGAHGLAVDGTGQTIVVVDTGVDDEFELLQERVVAGFHAHLAVACPEPPVAFPAAAAGKPMVTRAHVMDHGTQVATVAAHMAPKADIVALRVDEPDGSIPASNVVTALEQVFCRRSTLAHPAAAICVSLAQAAGSDGYGDSCDASSTTAVALAALVEKLEAADVAVVVAAGNQGYSGKVSFPACLERVIAVGATTDKDITTVDYPTRWTPSNWSTQLDLVAPGEYVAFAVSFDYYPYTVGPGTSIAAPLVAGAFALLRQGAAQRTVQQIRDALYANGTDVVDSPSSITARQLDVGRAASALAAAEAIGPGGNPR